MGHTCLSDPWPCGRFTSVPSLVDLWKILTTADQEHPTRVRFWRCSNPAPFDLLLSHHLWDKMFTCSSSIPLTGRCHDEERVSVPPFTFSVRVWCLIGVCPKTVQVEISERSGSNRVSSRACASEQKGRFSDTQTKGIWNEPGKTSISFPMDH